MNRNKYIENARDIINHFSHNELRANLIKLKTELFNEISNQEIESCNVDVSEMHPVEAFNYGFAVGNLSMVSELLTGIRYEKLNKPESEYIKEAADELLQEVRENILKIYRSQIQELATVLCTLYDLFDELRNIDIQVSANSDAEMSKKVIMNLINKVLEARERIVSRDKIKWIRLISEDGNESGNEGEKEQADISSFFFNEKKNPFLFHQDFMKDIPLMGKDLNILIFKKDNKKGNNLN